MIIMMLSGTLARQPEQRTSKNGNSFAVATVRDPVTIIDNGKVTTYQGKDGDTKAGLSITASRIIAMTDRQAPPRPRGNGQRRTRDPHQPALELPPIEAYNDPIPF